MSAPSIKRSRVNQIMRESDEFIRSFGYVLPPFAYWSPEEWRTKGAEFDEIRNVGLGWDVTDFGSGDLRRIGRTIFTLRNGKKDRRYPKAYAQKAMHMIEDQKSVIHYHLNKMEDICNQGGGNVMILFWAVAENGQRGMDPLTLSMGGRKIIQPAGEPLRLVPGDAVCVPPRTYHQFWSEAGHGPTLSIEVSSVCDDHTDNYFLDGGRRFPAIEEDEPSRYALCNEYENKG